MTTNTVYARQVLPFDDDENYQTFGDLKFFPNGGLTLGPTTFARGVPIHCYRFGANLVALRHIDQPNLVEIELPFGGRLRFLYRPLFRKWYQIVSIDDPRLSLHQERYGKTLAIALYYVRSGVRWTVVETVQLLLLALAVGAIVVIARLMK